MGFSKVNMELLTSVSENLHTFPEECDFFLVLDLETHFCGLTLKLRESN